MKREILLTVLSTSLILMFMYAAFSKVFDWPGFTHAMEMQPVPNWSKTFLQWSVPIVEIFISIALIFSRSRLWGFYGASVVMLAFTVYVGLGIANLLPYTPCACGGVISQFTWPQHFAFNSTFLLIAVSGIIAEKKLLNNKHSSSLTLT
ncbi:MauE/DoxX family redox-associated membrane protein [Chitinophaga vietnamensis]|uniref:MauE/DoxX family redox-associated membrane protein n=1 Tax=Chitinophaga vietnamensis TaxID=2593957 RepID=UPI001178AFE0|nr:MauE/DoxX family redox-associated membrane protein [Chitinophaga vietnamensis]